MTITFLEATHNSTVWPQTTLVIPTPVSAVPGTLLIAIMSNYGTAVPRPFTLPTGFTLIGSVGVAWQTDWLACYRFVQAGDPSGYAWGSTLVEASAGPVYQLVYSGVDHISNFATSADNSAGTGTSFVFPSVTTVGANAVLACILVENSSINFTNATSLIQIDALNSNGWGGSYLALGQVIATPGITGTRTVTGSAATTGGVLVSIALEPPPILINISVQPTSQSVTAPLPATFSVTASSANTISYQWQRNPGGVGAFANVVGGTGGTTATYTTVATSVTGGSANNSDQYRVLVTDINGTVASNAVTLTVAADTTAPTLTGTISVTNVTSTSATITSPTATDNIAVAGYQYSLNGGAWTLIAAAANTVAITALTPNSVTPVQMRAIDSAGNVSTPLTSSINTVAAPSISVQPVNQAVTAPATATFSVTASGTGLAYQWQRQLIGLGAFTSISGANSSSYITPSSSVTGGNANNGDVYRCVITDSGGLSVTSTSATLTVNPGADTIPPTQSGTITVSNLTPTSYTLTWPLATDNVGVAGYEYSLNGGTSYTSAGNVLTVNISGRTAYTSDVVNVRAYDAAGNRSIPALSTTVNLPAGIASVTTSPLENLSGSLHLGVVVNWSWFPGGRIGSLKGITPVEGTATSNVTTGTVTATGLPVGDGVLMTSVLNANRLLDTVHMQFLTAA